MASGFAFNFLVDEDPENTSSTACKDSDTPPSDGQLSSIDRLPFRWIDPVPLLLEHSKREMVCNEISLLKSSKDANDEDCDDSSNCKEPETNDPSYIWRKPLRFVDLEQSCILQKKNKKLEKNETNTNTLDQPTTSDLVTGIYEGGLKLWEASLDMIHHFTTPNWEDSDVYRSLLAAASSSEKQNTTVVRILELGCGHGLPACLFLRQAIACFPLANSTQQPDNNSSNNQETTKPFQVTFLDYNEAVLVEATTANIMLNTLDVAKSTLASPELIASTLRLGAGDWLDFSRKHVEEKFDVILAAETLYTKESCVATACLLQTHLAQPHGKAYLATKRYYFGVGGGTDEFTNALAVSQSQDESETTLVTLLFLSMQSVEVWQDGMGNIRELLCVRWEHR